MAQNDQIHFKNLAEKMLQDFESLCEYFGSLCTKDAEATCVKIATEMKKCSRLKEMSNFNVL